MNADQNSEAWKRLSEGKPLADMGLGQINGRLDLTHLLAPEPVIRKTTRTKLADVSELAGITVFKNVRWKSLDFSGSRLNSLRFFDSEISDCVFNGCDCRDWRFWGTTFSNISFCSADLRNSALGGVQEGKINQFEKVDFSGADLRQTAYRSARFANCLFKNTRLDKVNFHGSIFIDCRFEGELREVCFNRTAFGTDGLRPNEMLRVNFSNANLRWVEFRGLDMSDVRFPNDPDHILVTQYAEALEELLLLLRERSDMPSKKLAACIEVFLKWAGPKQRQGVLNKKDLLEAGGDEGLRFVLGVLEARSS